eukprot:COSAG06_NODE_6471_length_2920_cov_252.537044_2_plen_74_part_00
MSRQSLNLEQMWWAPSQFQDTTRKWGVLHGILLEYFLGRSPSASASANEGAKGAKRRGKNAKREKGAKHRECE